MRRRSCSPWRRSSSLVGGAPAGCGPRRRRQWRGRRSDRGGCAAGPGRSWIGSQSGRGRGPARGEQAEHGDGGGLVVDEDAALAGGEDFAAEDDLVAFGVDAVLFKDGVGGRGGLEDAGDDGLVGTVADHFGDDLPPISSARASTRMDLPAPVSPVSRLSPGPKTAMA
jgi:hypothetical protein